MWHKVSSSQSITGFPVYQMTNMFWFMQLNTSKSRYIFFVIYYLTVKIWYKLVGYLIIRRDPKIIGAYIHGIRDGLKPIETFKEAHKR